MALITNTEVVSIAFDREIQATRIKDAAIVAAQWKYIRPILSDELYEDVLTNPDNYTDLINDYIKTPLAYYTRFMLHNDLNNEFGNRGVQAINTQVSNSVSENASDKVKFSNIEIANQHASILLNYVQKQDFNKYEGEENTRYEMIGGFLIETDIDPINTPNQSAQESTAKGRVIFDEGVVKIQYFEGGQWKTAEIITI